MTSELERANEKAERHAAVALMLAQAITKLCQAAFVADHVLRSIPTTTEFQRARAMDAAQQLRLQWANARATKRLFEAIELGEGEDDA